MTEDDSPPFRLPRHPRSLAATARGPDRYLSLVLAGAGALLIAGWTLPIMTIRQLFIVAEQLSILDGIAVLWGRGEVLLFLIVFVFTVAFPAVKTTAALLLWYSADVQGRHVHRSLDWLELLGRWSMLDVFVVALTIVAIEISLISDVTTHAGLYVFTAAVVLSMLAVRRLLVLAKRATS